MRVSREVIFEKKLEEIRALTQFERDQVMAGYRDRCICPVCPNHNTCAMSKHEWFYCFTGKSFLCIDFERTCICPTCPVAKETGLKHEFFCMRGAETAQRYEHTLWGTKIP
jgi:Protein of unknown function (DUF2769)